ncbi:MAG: hypothetical protein CBB97_06910 [Candidatus Endolissoclinum sp. TMED37]|nr:MAG: hypothetical protein CBB97_06910 [Candidatus Endolissoclinum sp. TMED37]|tara:strand:+ start:308 stop:748 length:441 start_codon:yes stop_codon:yes gene_type:complete
MSKLVRDKFNKEHSMPLTKVMGTISPDIGRKINQMVLSGVTADAKAIVDHINTMLQTEISGISADQFPEPFESEPKSNADYTNPTGLFFLVTKGSASLKIDGTKNTLGLNKVFFINERCPYVILNPTKEKLIMMSAKFTWDKIKHA